MAIMNKRQKERLERLMPNGIPKYIRVYDNGGKTIDQYTVVYTGNYRKPIDNGREKSWFQHVGMSECPFHPQGFGVHGESPKQIDVNKWGFTPAMGRRCHLGKRIPFIDLPSDCQKLVLQDYRSIWNLPDPLESLISKLHPSRFSAMSNKMAGIVGCILGQKWVTPAFNDIVVTSDKFVLAQVEGDCGHNHFLGAASDLARNWNTLLAAADLCPDERRLAYKLFSQKLPSAIGS